MTLALHINDDELFKLGCYPDSPVGLFWAKFAERRPTAVPDMEKVCKKIAQTIEHDYCAESVEDMPKLLTEHQLQQVMAKEGGKPTWSGLLTYILGSFKPSVAAGVNNISTPLPPAPLQVAHNPLEAPYEYWERFSGIENEKRRNYTAMTPYVWLHCHRRRNACRSVPSGRRCPLPPIPALGDAGGTSS